MDFTTTYNFIDNVFHDNQTYWFYHKAHFNAPHPEPRVYKRILSSANNEITIWDPYFNIGDGQLFDAIKDGVTINILVNKGCSKSGTSYDVTPLQLIFNDIKNHVTSIDNQACVRSINKLVNSDWACHDRFLIIDQSDVYLIGSSIGYHVTAEAATGIFKINDAVTSAFILSVFDSYWAKGLAAQIPIAFIS